MSYHNLLDKQLKKHLSAELISNESLKPLLEVISETYTTLERDKSLAERAFSFSEQEYVEVNERLKQELDLKQLSIAALKDAVATITELENNHSDDDLLGLADFITLEIKRRKSAESVFTSLITNLKNGILLEDENRNIRFVNQMFCQFFSIPVPPEALHGMDCSNSAEESKIMFKDPELFVSSIDKCLKNRVLVTGEMFEMIDGRVVLRDYIPIFSENKYRGHLWSYTDITEAKRIQDAVVESEERNRKIMNAALDAIITVDNQGKITFWNPQSERIFGWKKEEVLGKPIADFIITEEDKMEPQDGMKPNLESEHSPVLNKQIELPAMNKAGERLSIELYILPIGEGENKFFCSFIRDITEKKKTELEKERLSLVASANENGIMFLGDDDRIFWCNNGLLKLTGYTEQEIYEGDPFKLFTGPLSRNNNWKSFFEQYRRGGSFSTEFILYKKDGSWIWCRVKGQNLSSADQGSHYVVMLEDISEEKEVQLKLREYEERLKIALNNVGDNYWEHDFRKGQTLFLNATNEFLGFEGSEIDNMADFWWSRVHPDDRAILEKSDILYKKGLQKKHSSEYRIAHKDNQYRWIFDRGVVTEFDEQGLPQKIIGTHIDITRQKQLERELTEAKEDAEASTRAKELFLANMSHEIRTPMNAILGMANQMGKTPLTDNQQFYLNNIQSATDNLLIIINDILDLSKIEAGELMLEKIGFVPSEVISRVMNVMSYKAEEKGIRLANSWCDTNLSPVIIGDPYRLNQILLNLVSNAIKFTERGSVDISCRVLEDHDTYQLVEASVTDTGVGMDEEFVKKLYQKFRQEDDSITRKFGGTGLGMSICKELVELMEGEIVVESKKGRGTRVSIRIPFIKGSIDDLPVKEKSRVHTEVLKGKHILVTDDNEMNRLVASTILESYEAIVEQAEDGLMAFEKIKEKSFDLVLMDIQMPVMDGLQSTQKIRDAGFKDLPVIALTALALKGDETKFLKAGMNDYIVKPFEEEKFLRVVCNWMISKSHADGFNSTDAQSLYSLDKLNAIGGGNEAFLRKMTDLFKTLAPATLVEMEEAYRTGDFQKVGKLAHKLKPSLDQMDIKSLHEIVREVENQAVTYGQSPALEALLHQLKSTVLAVIEDLNNRY